MIQHHIKRETLLITGGTSGLGLELVRLFLRMGFNVIATGRRELDIREFGERFKLYHVDFSSLSRVAEVTKKICREHDVSIIINNAGVLSPPQRTESTDGFEYTFQVNYLSHLLMNRIILNRVADGRNIGIAAVISPVYKLAGKHPSIESRIMKYSPLSSYSSSKLYLAMMCEFLPSEYPGINLKCFSFDPGTFSSGIGCLQKRWFRRMYKIASPFMRKPGKVARALAELILRKNISNGLIYNRLKRKKSVPIIDQKEKELFLKNCSDILTRYL